MPCHTRKARDFRDRKTSILLYKSLVLPHLDYCDTVYGCTSIVNLQKLQMVQNSVCRTLLLADKRCPAELELLKLDQRRELHLTVDSHKHVYNVV